MKPRNIIMAMILFVAVICDAREYLPMLVEGREIISEVRHTYAAFAPFGNMKSEYLDSRLEQIYGDTVIDGVNCKKTWFGILYEDNGKLFRYNTKLEKFIQYVDMAAEEGDHMQSCDLGGNAYTAFVVRVDYIETGGVKRKRLLVGEDLASKAANILNIYWIEGLGITEWAWAPNFVVTDARMQCASEYFDNDQRIASREDLYSGDPRCKWIPMVRDDRIWVYGGIDSDGKLYRSYCRFGAEEKIGIRRYRPFYEFRKEIWDNPEDPDDVRISEEPSFPVRYLREQCGSVYMFDEITKSNENREKIIYRFLSPYFDAYYLRSDNYYDGCALWATTNYEDFTNYGVPFCRVDVGEITIAGETRKTYQYNCFFDFAPLIIEGIGMTTNGFLPYFLDNEVVLTDYAPRLLEYCDGDGNVLHKFASLEDVVKAGVGAVAQPDNSSPVYYNLQGQPIANPVRGEIYILRDSSGSRKVVY